MYVTVVLVVMARQFSFLSALDPDPEQDKVAVVDSAGTTALAPATTILSTDHNLV